jgi:predicted kinase
MKQEDVQKLFIMLIGVPAAGKSYFIKNTLPALYPTKKFTIISSDDILDRKASEQGKTYSEVFRYEAKAANIEMNQNFKSAIEQGNDIVWDQTNLSVKVRKEKLSKVPTNYYKIAIVFKTPNSVEHQKRLSSRPGKNIPPNVISSMIANFQPPTEAEGFDKILNV